MPFVIVRNDITQMKADAIVNTANPRPVVGTGTDSMIHEKAGLLLRLARQRLGSIPRGGAAVTPAYNLKAKYVIHTVGPVWEDGRQNEEQVLRSCYDNSLRLAMEKGCKSVAFPLISTGNYGFPKDKALQIAISAFSSFLMEQEMQIYLVVYDRDSYKLSEKLFQSVESYIDEHYVASHERFACAAVEENRRPRFQTRRWEESDRMESAVLEEGTAFAPMPAPKAASLEELLKQADAGFSERLLQLIDKAGKKDSQVYKKALLSKQHFSKIRNNPQYKPTKATAISLALALELDLEETRDLIGRAGYALTNSSKFDLIIRYHIERGKYDVVEINCVLFDHDQPLLGS